MCIAMGRAAAAKALGTTDLQAGFDAVRARKEAEAAAKQTGVSRAPAPLRPTVQRDRNPLAPAASQTAGLKTKLGA
jgi:hypothetical protein